MGRLIYTESATPNGHKVLQATDGKTEYRYVVGSYCVHVIDEYDNGSHIDLQHATIPNAKAAIRQHKKENN